MNVQKHALKCKPVMSEQIRPQYRLKEGKNWIPFLTIWKQSLECEKGDWLEQENLVLFLFWDRVSLSEQQKCEITFHFMKRKGDITEQK